jgi:hypothetical protein
MDASKSRPSSGLAAFDGSGAAVPGAGAWFVSATPPGAAAESPTPKARLTVHCAKRREKRGAVISSSVLKATVALTSQRRSALKGQALGRILSQK